VMRGISVEVPLQTPAELAKFLAEDIQRNQEVIRIAKIVLE
jgi:tripartite-type tricarboxylate transporter receptor subunit TctC